MITSFSWQEVLKTGAVLSGGTDFPYEIDSTAFSARQYSDLPH
jgi:predicted amidohydrolase YtcJ